MRVAGVIRDAGPDAWGQRVILDRHLGRLDRSRDTAELGTTRLPAGVQQRSDRCADIIERQVTVITEQWDSAADAAELTDADRSQMWGRQILNPAVHYTG